MDGSRFHDNKFMCKKYIDDRNNYCESRKRGDELYSRGVSWNHARAPPLILYTIEMRLLVATTNPGKMTEIVLALSDPTINVFGLDSFRLRSHPEETGSTFADNALLKARFYHAATGLPTVSDDSGLEVDALEGRPGVFSARYAGALSTDQDRIDKLLREIKGVPLEKRGARFVCAAALVWEREEVVFYGEVRGSILEEPRGKLGFGYDPVFYHNGLGRTFAEMTVDQKSSVSHRGIALARLASWIKLSDLN